MNNFLKYSIGLIIFCFLISSILLIWWPVISALRIAFGSVYVLFLPGLIWSFVFLQKDILDFDLLERFTSSIILSISLISVITFIFYKIGVAVNLYNLFFIILSICLIGLLILLGRFLSSKKNILSN